MRISIFILWFCVREGLRAPFRAGAHSSDAERKACFLCATAGSGAMSGSAKPVDYWPL